MSKDLNLFSLLNANNYFSVNREIAHKIGLHASIMLTEIIDKFCFFEKLGQLDDGWFYLKVQDAFERTTLGEKAQKAAISILIKLKLLQTKQRGIPAKRYFKISEENIQKWLKLKEYLRTSQKAEQQTAFGRNYTYI